MLQMVNKILYGIIALFTVTGCNNLDIKGLFFPVSTGVEKRFSQSMDLTGNKTSSSIETEDEYMFYVCTDPHVDVRTDNIDTFINALQNDDDASFGIILGDCTDRRNNMDTYMKAVSYSEERHEHRHNIFHILGNHDIYFDGWEEFRNLLGPSVYCFESKFSSGSDLFICLDSANGTLGHKQTEWLRSLLERNRSRYRHCFILTHTNIFYTDNSQVSSGNMPLEETFALLRLFRTHNVSLVLQGHDHYREDLFHDNVRYTVVGAISEKVKEPEYLKIKVSPEGMAYEWIQLNRQ